MTPRLSGRVALVTGASRRQGIGAAVCRALARDGADIAFTHWRDYDRQMRYTDDDGPAALLAEMSALGQRAVAIEADFTDAATPAAVIRRVVEALGPLTIVVNNAAHSTRDGYEALDAATLDAHYAVNLRATALLSVTFAKQFDAGTGGRIINLTSGQFLSPMPDELAYAASKGAIEAFTTSLAPAVAPKGITVNAVGPGPTDTGWMSSELRAEIVRQFPTGRVGQPEDAARLIAFLASDDAAWITGQIIHSEGGFWRR